MAKIKATLICFFYHQGAMHKAFVLRALTLTKLTIENYFNDYEKRTCVSSQILHALGYSIVTMNSVTLHCLVRVYARSYRTRHVSARATLFFADFKNHLRVRHFDAIHNIQKNETDQSNSLTDEHFQHCFQEGKVRPNGCDFRKKIL